jgi:hypothetical protein
LSSALDYAYSALGEETIQEHLDGHVTPMTFFWVVARGRKSSVSSGKCWTASSR